MLVSIILGFLFVLLLGLPPAFIIARKSLREQKNFERGLKMVPLKIHLPPQSDDAEAGGRDTRDVIDENISKAQIMYNIVAGTAHQGFMNKFFYGQRHISFEIVGVGGFVEFYTAVPVSLVEVVKQAVVSAYPSAQLEEVPEYNLFSSVGKISGTAGGELTLKENAAYPIATYQDLKRDALQSMLSSLSTINDNDGVGIQFLMRPAHSDWRKEASAIASQKRKGEKKGGGPEKALGWVNQAFRALTAPPEEGGGGDKPELSNADQAVIDSIDAKTQHPGFEVIIRVVASSDVSQRAQTIVKNVVAAFALFDSQGKNGFKYTPAKDIESFVTAYIMRFFPQENDKNVLNTVELSTLFHFPDEKNIPTSQLQRQASKQVDGPRNMSEDGMLLGYNLFRGAKKPIRLAHEDRQRHLYAVGQTGTGKSTFLENMALQDMLAGNGLAFVDPHGDTAEKLLSMVPKERTEDVLYFCPADMDYPMGLNLFEYVDEYQKDFIIQECINMLYKLYDPQRQGIIGPRFERIFTNCAQLLMADPNGGTFVDVPKLLIDPQFMKEKLKYTKDQNVLDFWTKEWPNAQRSQDAGEVTSWVVSKFGAFLSNEMMRNIIGQNKSSFNLRDIMDNKKILLVNLSKGRTGDINSRLLGMIFVMKFQAAAMSRSDVPESERVDFGLYVDEFQSFSTDSFATIMSEARKYRLSLIVANQFTTQLTEEIRDAVFGNIGTIVSFRVGQNDVETLARYFQPTFDGEDLLRIPNHNAVVRTLVNGVPTAPFSMATIPPLGEPNKELFLALRQLSAAKYGRPKAKVEAEVFERLATKDSPKPGVGQSGMSPGGGGLKPGAARKRPGSGPSSFLDDWLAKRKAAPSPSGAPTAATKASPQQPGGPSSGPAAPKQPSSAPPQTTPSPASSSSPQAGAGSATGQQASPPPTQPNRTEPQKASSNETPPPAKKTEGELHVHKDDGTDEDTITIDKDGTLHRVGESQE
ncbi:MAG: ATP-binding protein [Candidatus Saccharibacteria bacterium]|nr:ATP-binding protein [Candidatus Saccharibacteria bacterium]